MWCARFAFCVHCLYYYMYFAVLFPFLLRFFNSLCVVRSLASAMVVIVNFNVIFFFHVISFFYFLLPFLLFILFSIDFSAFFFSSFNYFAMDRIFFIFRLFIALLSSLKTSVFIIFLLFFFTCDFFCFDIKSPQNKFAICVILLSVSK